MARRTLVIVNPRSRNGATGRRWAAVETRLRRALGGLEVEFTRGPRDAERIAREGVRAGSDRIVVAGGDGTLSEIATGLLAADLAGYAEIGLLPLGTGGDFMRTLGLPARLDDALRCLTEGKVLRLDAGRVRCRDESGRDATSYFLNIASVGISGVIVQLVNRAPRAFGGTASFLVGTLRGIARYRPPDVAVRVDGRLVHSGPLTFATAANGRYFGGGMHVAPAARLDDAELDAVVASGLSRAALLARLPAIYRGTHLALPSVTAHRGRRIEFEAAPGEARLEADGEPLGSAPAVVDVLPAAISLLAPRRPG